MKEISPIKPTVYRFTREDLKTKKASGFKHGDLITVSHYGITIRYHDTKHTYDTPGLLSRVEDLNTNKAIGWSNNGDLPYYLFDFIHS